ncbi:uncharacterized protein LOC109723420 [Ananas comosus]|nr:uncharacterized protein LOC109723420 [Ananas comosus]
MGDGAEAEESVGGGREAGGERSAPAMVTFPDARRNLNSIPPIKLEAEDAADDATPHTMWQVYILGGFLVLRWVWARWKERKEKGRAPDDPSS